MSTGTAIVTDDIAAMWTDGRYFLQAAQQMDSNWTLMKHGMWITCIWRENLTWMLLNSHTSTLNVFLWNTLLWPSVVSQVCIKPTSWLLNLWNLSLDEIHQVNVELLAAVPCGVSAWCCDIQLYYRKHEAYKVRSMFGFPSHWHLHSRYYIQCFLRANKRT